MRFLLYIKDNEKKIIAGSFVLCTLLQAIIIIHYGINKPNLFMDEYWSYNLANSYFFPFLRDYHSTLYYDHWLTSADWVAGLSVDPNHIFSYSSVIFNQGMDVHPPLYYIVLHSICSLFPGEYSRWFGLMPNVVFFIITQFFLYKSTKMVIKSKWISLSVCIIYGFSWGAINTAVFIRMYMLLTLLGIGSFFAHLKFVEAVENERTINKSLLGIYLVTVLGVMTQYYFLIYQFYLSLAILFYLLYKTNRRNIIKYCITMFCMLGSSVALFPSIINQISGKSGNQGITFLGKYTRKGFLERVITCFDEINLDLLGGHVKLTLLLFSLIIMLLYVLNKYDFIVYKAGKNILLKINVRVNKDTFTIHIDFICFLYRIILAFVIFAFFLTVAKIAPFLEPRYFYVIYPLLIIFFANVLNMILNICRFNLTKNIIYTFMVFFILSLNFHQYSRDKIQFSVPVFAKVVRRVDQEKINVIELNDSESWWPVFAQYKLFKGAPYSYLLKDDKFRSLPGLIHTMPGNQNKLIIIKVSNKILKEKEFIDFVRNNTDFKHYEKSLNYFGDIYCFSK